MASQANLPLRPSPATTTTQGREPAHATTNGAVFTPASFLLSNSYDEDLEAAIARDRDNPNNTGLMRRAIARVSDHHIARFFSRCRYLSFWHCMHVAALIAGEVVRPVLFQGSRSFTVSGGEWVVQFRVPGAALDMRYVEFAKVAYEGWVPDYQYKGRLFHLHVYKMEDLEGVTMYLAREALHANGFAKFKVFLQGYANFFSSPYFDTPPEMPLPDRQDLLALYRAEMSVLRRVLPARFLDILNYINRNLAWLLSDDWPLVINHSDLKENNLHVSPESGQLLGVCDWHEVEVSPFGMSLGWLELQLGVSRRGGRWEWLDGQDELRDHFWDCYKEAFGGWYDERNEVAKALGLFHRHAFVVDAQGRRCVRSMSDPHMQWLDDIFRRETEEARLFNPPEGEEGMAAATPETTAQNGSYMDLSD